MLQISKINGKQFDYEVKKVIKNEWQGTPITKMSVNYKEKDNTYTTIWIIVWGADLDIKGFDFNAKTRGDRIVILGANKIGLGKIHNNVQPIELYCDKEQLILIKNSSSRVSSQVKEMELKPIEDDCLPF